MKVTVYCSFRDGWCWHGQGSSEGTAVVYESNRRAHGSARQAADEVLGKVQTDHPTATMRRLSPKTYEIPA